VKKERTPLSFGRRLRLDLLRAVINAASRPFVITGDGDESFQTAYARGYGGRVRLGPRRVSPNEFAMGWYLAPGCRYRSGFGWGTRTSLKVRLMAPQADQMVSLGSPTALVTARLRD
jgi:hypothetical protein